MTMTALWTVTGLTGIHAVAVKISLAVHEPSILEAFPSHIALDTVLGVCKV